MCKLIMPGWKGSALFLLFLIFCGCNNTDKTILRGPQPKPVKVYSGFNIPYSAFFNLDSAKECSRQSNRPILVLYTIDLADSDPKETWKMLLEEDVQKQVKDNFVFAILFLDDATPLARIDTSQKSFSGIIIETTGQKNCKREIDKYQQNGQPLYTIIDCNENDLAKPIGYYPFKDKQKFIDFLNEGIKNSKH